MRDAKVYAMIEDLSHAGLLDALSYPEAAWTADTEWLRSCVRQDYDAGTIESADIIFAWEDDATEKDDATEEAEFAF